MLATATFLVVKGGVKTSDTVVVEEIKDENMATQPDLTAVSIDGKFNGSINDLIERGGDYECDFTHSTDVSDSAGTVFISGKKMRGDFSSTTKIAANIKVESHMISDGEFLYNWSSAMPTGFKTVINKIENTVTSESAGPDYNQKLEYNCKIWNVDDSKFMIPSDVKFTTI